MRKSMTAMAAVFVFTACDGNPFLTATTTTTDTTETVTNATTGTTTTTTTTGITGGSTLPPGTASPTPNNDIFRYEPTDTIGGGFATSFSYDSATDTFTVDNLPFDGTAAYNRVAAPNLASLGPYAIYENSAPVTDPQSGATVPQLDHKALYGVSTSGRTQFAIVRTGAYNNYGFGGFVYQRNGEVTLPTSGQALYSGIYAAVQDYTGQGGIQYVQGDMNMYIDFDDFNTSAGVRGEVNNRRIFDTAGNDVTNNRITEINAQNNSTIAALPVLRFVVADGAADANGEIQGAASSFITDNTGARVQLEAGNYYAIVAGPNAEEVVGIVVTTYAVNPTITARDTGGFILYR